MCMKVMVDVSDSETRKNKVHVSEYVTRMSQGTCLGMRDIEGGHHRFRRVYSAVGTVWTHAYLGFLPYKPIQFSRKNTFRVYKTVLNSRKNIFHVYQTF